jgi:L-lactate dehydrogenase (cytochrome)
VDDPLMRPASIGDYRDAARKRLPHFLFEYLDGGSYAEGTLRNNITDLGAIALRQRILRDVSAIDLSIALFGKRQALPVALAPVGLAGMNARRGEVQAARAAHRAGVPFCLSTVSACSLPEVARDAGPGFWFQMYMMRDRGFMRDLLAQATDAGCQTLVFTVDMPVPGSRYRDYRSGLAGSSGMMGSLRRTWQAMQRPRWAWDVGIHGRPHTLGNVEPILSGSTGLEDFFAWMRNNFDPSVTWQDFAAVRRDWPGTLIIKGILDVDDARAAADAGADGIVVSNHGGRQLDGAPSTARALPPIANAVRDRLTVLADGGIRSGVDVVRMLALGAHGVLLGRAWAYALAAGGQAGVAHMLELLSAEMRVAMALTGCAAIADIGRDTLA